MRILIVSLLALTLQGQTRVRWDQLNKYSEAQTSEGEWCTAPNLKVVNDKQLVVGEKWTDADPCYIHYSIIPPGGVDPLSISKFTAPQFIDLNPNFTGDDEIYIWATEPKFTPTPTPSKIYVGVKDVNALQCPTCLVVAQTTTPRVFPAGVVPVGFVQIVQGKLHPKANDVLDSHQIHIAGAPMVVHKKENGYFFEINPATVQAQAQQRQLEQSRTQMEVARNNAVQSLAKAEPIPMQLVKRLTEQVNQLQKRNFELQMEMNKLKIPHQQEIISAQRDLNELKGHVQQFRQEYGNLEHVRETVQGQVSYHVEMQTQGILEQVRSRLDPMISRVDPPKSSSDQCFPSQWARDKSYYYQCVQNSDGGSEWIRSKIDPWDVRLAEGPKPGTENTLPID